MGESACVQVALATAMSTTIVVFITQQPKEDRGYLADT
jgi:hypothetical protein